VAKEARKDPSSLRERQAAVGRNAILDSAAALFVKKGYKRTTMQAIADGADVGVATVFRHFKNKAGILAAISQRDMEEVLAQCEEVLESSPSDPVEGTLAIIAAFLRILDMPNSGFRWQTDLWLPVHTGQPEADAVVAWADEKVQEFLRKLLAPFQRDNILDPSIDLDAMVKVIFFVFNQNFLSFATTPSITKEIMEADIEHHVRILFQPWLTPDWNEVSAD